jgi:hypothetical protein
MACCRTQGNGNDGANSADDDGETATDAEGTPEEKARASAQAPVGTPKGQAHEATEAR